MGLERKTENQNSKEAKQAPLRGTISGFEQLACSNSLCLCDVSRLIFFQSCFFDRRKQPKCHPRYPKQ
jgi:hypothetical protein